jgi:hypothetical protein
MSMRWLGNGPIFCSSFLKSKYQIKLHSKGFNAVNHDFRFFFFFFFLTQEKGGLRSNVLIFLLFLTLI